MNYLQKNYVKYLLFRISAVKRPSHEHGMTITRARKAIEL